MGFTLCRFNTQEIIRVYQENLVDYLKKRKYIWLWFKSNLLKHAHLLLCFYWIFKIVLKDIVHFWFFLNPV